MLSVLLSSLDMGGSWDGADHFPCFLMWGLGSENYSIPSDGLKSFALSHKDFVSSRLQKKRYFPNGTGRLSQKVQMYVGEELGSMLYI